MQTQILTKLLQFHLTSFSQLSNPYYLNLQQFFSPNSIIKKFYHLTTQSLHILYKTETYLLLTLPESIFFFMTITKLFMLTNSLKTLILNPKDSKCITLFPKTKSTNLFSKYNMTINSILIFLLIFLNNNS